ncbi:MAG: exo-rhamnogalacturonan lyase family protein [Armatimonadota bacterium]
MECYQGHRFKQVLIDDTVVWEADVGDSTSPCFVVDVTPYVQRGKPFRLALRVMDKIGTDTILPGDFMHIGTTETAVKKMGDPRRFLTDVWWGDVMLWERDDGKEPAKPRSRPIEHAVAKRHQARFPLPPLHTPWDAPVTLGIETPCPLPKDGFPVTCGVPLPLGKVQDVRHVGLQGSKGRVVPVQCQVLNRWTDGSVRWVLVDLLAKPGSSPYQLVIGQSASSRVRQSVRVFIRDKKVVLDTGRLIVELGSNPSHLIDHVTLKASGQRVAEGITGRLIIERDGKAQIYHPRWEDIEVTARGPIRATVEMRGYLAGEGDSIGRFVLRLSVYAGQSLIRAFSRVFNDTPQPLKVKSFVLSVPLSLSSDRQIAWGDANGTFQQIESSEAELLQVSAQSYSIHAGNITRSGERAAGWLSVHDAEHTVLVAIRHFWQTFPKSLSVTSETLNIHLFAPTPEVPAFEPTPGEAKRHEILLFFDRRQSVPALANLATLLLNPPRLFSSDWFCASGGLGAAHPHRDPAFQPLREFMARTYGDVAHERFNLSFGIRHFGDRRYVNDPDPVKNYWCNNYYDAMMGFFAEYLMSGDRRWFDRGEETTLHVMDIDQNHYDQSHPENVGGIHAYNSPNHTQGGYWDAMLRQGAGFATYYRLTGDPDAREALLMLADFIVRNRRGLGSTSSRDHAGPLQTLTWAYDETGDEKYLRACRWIVEDLLSGRVIDRRRGAYVEIHGNYNYRGNIPWMDVQLAEPLYLHYRHTGDLDAAQIVVGLCESIICENMTLNVPGDFYGYSHNPHYAKTSNYHVLIAPTMLYAYDLTGDPEFLICARSAFEQTLRENTINPVVNCYWNTPTLLYFLPRERKTQSE